MPSTYGPEDVQVEIAWDNCHKPADIKKDEACEMEEGQAAHAKEPKDLGP